MIESSIFRKLSKTTRHSLQNWMQQRMHFRILKQMYLVFSLPLILLSLDILLLKTPSDHTIKLIHFYFTYSLDEYFIITLYFTAIIFIFITLFFSFLFILLLFYSQDLHSQLQIRQYLSSEHTSRRVNRYLQIS